MKEILREAIIYQLVAVVLTLLNHNDFEFFQRLPGYLIITNCIAWSIRTMFWLLSLRVDFLQLRRRWQILAGLPAVAAGCFMGVLLTSIIFRMISQQDIDSSLFLDIFQGSLPTAIIVTILLIIFSSYRERLERQVIEKERLKRLKATAELAALQSKLNPHFLFNTLNTMANLVHKEPDKVEEMILRLSEIYRKVLKLPSTEQISLAEEFDLAQQYLAIEQVRLGDRLNYTVQLPENLRKVNVPPLMIQPLVENAVIHGIMPSQRGGSISLSAWQENDIIHIVVEDDGVGINLQSEDHASASAAGRRSGRSGIGFGLHSVRQRLRLAYGGKGNIKIELPRNHGARITLELPIEH